MAGTPCQQTRLVLMNALINKWNNIYSQAEIALPAPAPVLRENAFLLPATGTALDLACGLGGNAIFLAQQQLAVTALDISNVAIEKLTVYAARKELNLCARRQAITPQSLGGQCFDVIVVSRFLDRTLRDAIIDALKPDGLLFYQTFTQEKTNRTGPSNPDYLLAENELLALFSPLRLLYYRDNGLCGKQQSGLRGEAQFIGQKRRQD